MDPKDKFFLDKTNTVLNKLKRHMKTHYSIS